MTDSKANDLKEISRAAFNRQAADYDSGVKGRHARSLYPVMLEQLFRLPFHTALDLGCGTGELMNRILLRDSGKILTGIDLSENMLREAKAKLGNRALLLLGDSERLPFGGGSFDVVFCNDSFHHYPAPDRVLSEIRRVLKPGGTFLMCDCWHPAAGRAVINFYMRHSREGDVRIYSEHEMRKLLSRHFSEIRWERVGHAACLACGVKGPEDNRFCLSSD